MGRWCLRGQEDERTAGIVGAGGMQAGAMLTALLRADALVGEDVVGIDRRWSADARGHLERLGVETWMYDVVSDRDELAERVTASGLTLLASLVGRFYAIGTAPLKVAIDAGVDYLDICEDADATTEALDLHPRAQSAGVRALEEVQEGTWDADASRNRETMASGGGT